MPKRKTTGGRSGKDGRKGKFDKKGPGGFRKRSRTFVLRKKKCRFCGDKNLKITHMDYQLLRKLITERGKITPSRISGTCAKHQRKLTTAIKRARNIGILPYLAK